MTTNNVRAKITNRPGFNVRIALEIAWLPKGATKAARILRERTLAAAAYRLAAQLELVAGEEMLNYAVGVDARDGIVTVELAEGATDAAAINATREALSRTGDIAFSRTSLLG